MYSNRQYEYNNKTHAKTAHLGPHAEKAIPCIIQLRLGGGLADGAREGGRDVELQGGSVFRSVGGGQFREGDADVCCDGDFACFDW